MPKSIPIVLPQSPYLQLQLPRLPKNYWDAEDRYREALLYKDNDAMATFRLGECLEKLGQPGAARDNYESYLKILPHGPFAEEARKSVERLKKLDSSQKPTK